MADLGSIGRRQAQSHWVSLPEYATTQSSARLDASGVISGVVTECGTPVKDVKATLMWRPTMTKIKHTWTDATGAYSFSGVDATKKYLVIAEDPSGGIQYNDLVYALVQPA